MGGVGILGYGGVGYREAYKIIGSWPPNNNRGRYSKILMGPIANKTNGGHELKRLAGATS